MPHIRVRGVDGHGRPGIDASGGPGLRVCGTRTAKGGPGESSTVRRCHAQVLQAVQTDMKQQQDGKLRSLQKWIKVRSVQCEALLERRSSKLRDLIGESGTRNEDQAAGCLGAANQSQGCSRRTCRSRRFAIRHPPVRLICQKHRRATLQRCSSARRGSVGLSQIRIKDALLGCLQDEDSEIRAVSWGFRG